MARQFTKHLKLIGLPILVAASPIAPVMAQTSRTRTLLETDPNGLILTLTAVFVVFSVLALLIFFFKGVGRLMQYLLKLQERKATKAEDQAIASSPNNSADANEVALAISLALQSELNPAISEEAVVAISLSLADYTSVWHDEESYKMTIRQRPSQWNSKAYGLRKYPH